MTALAPSNEAVVIPAVQDSGARLTPRNVAALFRFVALRLRHPGLRTGLFFVDRGADFQVGAGADVRIGKGLRIMRDFSGHFHGEVRIGDDVFFNRGCHVAVFTCLEIGSHCLFGERVSIHDENHLAAGDGRPLPARGLVASPIVIGDNVWVGANATILAGVHIGDNATIGASSVVTRDVPAGSVVVGAPARVIRERESL